MARLNQSFAFRISIYILLFVMVLFTIIFSIYYFYTRNIIIESTKENAAVTASDAVNKIENILLSVEQSAHGLALFMEKSNPTGEKIEEYLEANVNNNPEIYGSAVAFEPYGFDSEEKYFSPYAYQKDDKFILEYLGGENYEYFYKDWYLIPKMLEHPCWSEAYYDEGGGNTIMSSFSVPFYKTENGEQVFAGSAVCDIELEQLTTFVDSIKILETGYAFLISKTGTFVAHRNNELLMHESIFSLAKTHKEPLMREIGRNMIHGKSDFIKFESEVIPKSWLYYTPLPANGWSLGVIFPEEELFSGLHKMTYTIILLGLISIVLLWFIIIQVARRITIPLRRFAISARKVASGKFNEPLPEIKTRDEMGQLHDAFEHMQEELAHYIADLKSTTAAKEKIESELRIANEIQMGMIPKTFPPYPDHPDLNLFAVLEPAKEVGGDLYDFFFVGERKMCFAIGDVSGKGVPAALFMAVTRTLLRTIAQNVNSAKKIVETLNNSLSTDNESSMFVTFFLGILEVDTGDVVYVNAGHNPPVLIDTEGNASFMETTKGMALGFMDGIEFQERTINIKKGEIIYCYTDGVTEAENTKQDLYSDQRLLALLDKSKASGPRKLIKEVYDDVKVHVKGAEQSDDITMLALQIIKGN